MTGPSAFSSQDFSLGHIGTVAVHRHRLVSCLPDRVGICGRSKLILGHVDFRIAGHRDPHRRETYGFVVCRRRIPVVIGISSRTQRITTQQRQIRRIGPEDVRQVTAQAQVVTHVRRNITAPVHELDTAFAGFRNHRRQGIIFSGNHLCAR